VNSYWGHTWVSVWVHSSLGESNRLLSTAPAITLGSRVVQRRETCTLSTVGRRFVVDALLLGVAIQQFVLWHTYSASSERRWVKFLVVSMTGGSTAQCS
jgi:uncharacterized membrane protein